MNMNKTSQATQPQVEWTTDSEGYQFPCVPLSRCGWERWDAYHSVSAGTEWVDGALYSDDGRVESLDIVAIEADDICFGADDFDLAKVRLEARNCWDHGEVLHRSSHGVSLVFVPTPHLGGNVIALAVTRFMEGRR